MQMVGLPGTYLGQRKFKAKCLAHAKSSGSLSSNIRLMQAPNHPGGWVLRGLLFFDGTGNRSDSSAPAQCIYKTNYRVFPFAMLLYN